MSTPVIAPLNAARLQIGCMDLPLDAAFTDLIKGSPAPVFTRPGTESRILPAESSPEGWPNTADFNVGLHGGSGLGLPIDPLMVGRIRFSWRGHCANGFGIAGNSAAEQSTYDPATDRTTGSYIALADGANYSRLEFRGASFRDADGTRKPGLRDIQFFRPRHPGSLTDTYDATEPFTDEFLGYVRHFDYIRFFISATGLADWAGRTPPGWWSQGNGYFSVTETFPAYLHTIRPAGGPLGPSLETMIAIANAAGRSILTCFPPNATIDFMRKWVKATLYGTDASGNPYDGPASSPVHPPLDPSLWMTLEGGLEPWNFSIPYIVDMMSYCDLATYHQQQNDDIWKAITFDLDTTGWPNPGRPEGHPAFGDIVQRMRVMQLAQLADVIREIDPAALNTRIRLLYSPQALGARPALTWHENYFGKVHPDSPWTGPARNVRDDLWGAGAQSYWGFGDEHGLTGAIPDPSFASPAVAAGYALRPSGGAWSFSGEAGIARTNGSDVPPAYAGQQMGYVGKDGTATTSFVVPDGTMAVYDVKFKALRRASDPAQAQFKVYLDRGTPNELDITPQSYVDTDGTVAPRVYGQVRGKPAETWPARRVDYTDSDYLTSQRLNLTPGSTHTITVVGVGPAGTMVFLGEVRVGSADAIIAGAHPVLSYNPGAGVNLWSEFQRVDSSRIGGFGLRWFNYESAPNLGGDDHGTDLQQFIRYLAPGMVSAQLDVYRRLQNFGLSGCSQGVYRPLPSWRDPVGIQGLLNPGAYAIVKAADQVRAGALPAEPFGTPLPGTLNYSNRQYEDARPNNSYLTAPGETIGWTVVVNNPGVYRLEMTQASPAVAQHGPTSTEILVDGIPVAGGGDSITGEVGLPAGQHWIRIRQRAGNSGEATIVVTRIGDLPVRGPATSYTLTVGNSRVVGTPIPVTINLAGGPLGADLAISLNCGGAAASGPVVIPAGQVSGTGSITPTSAGAFALTATNKGGLTNPGPLTLTFTANPSTQPGSLRVLVFRR